MRLIQILLPLYTNDGQPQPRDVFRQVRDELAGRFGGLTTYTRAPASGLWVNGDDAAHDDLVLYEVMVEDVDRTWWGSFRASLEQRFAQDEIVVRSIPMERL